MNARIPVGNTMDKEKTEIPIDMTRGSNVILIPTPRTLWNLECFGKDGNQKWKMENMANLVTNEGKNANLNIMFHGHTQITPWYFVLFEDNYTPLIGNTYAVPGYTETTAYDELTRPEFTEIESTAQTTNNSASKATFTFNAIKTIYGGALVGGGTDPTVKANTAGGGTLYCSAKFSESKPVVSGDILKVWVTLTAS
jgi:hypothetical protein